MAEYLAKVSTINENSDLDDWSDYLLPCGSSLLPQGRFLRCSCVGAFCLRGAERKGISGPKLHYWACAVPLLSNILPVDHRMFGRLGCSRVNVKGAVVGIYLRSCA